MKNEFFDSILIFLRGLFMGTADIIPGVSGGTIALITGIYERLVHGIGKINFKFVKPLIKGDFSEFKTMFLKEIDFQLFIPLFLGIALAMLTLSKVIGFLLDYYTAYTFAFFLGLILASSYVLYTHLVKISPKIIMISIIGFVIAFIFVGLNPIATNHTLPVLFFSGMIAICAMILPGISGAFILVLLGQYKYMLNVLNTLSIVEIITFCLGALIGILGFSKLLDYLLKHYKEATLTFLIGVMLGTLRTPYNEIANNIDGSNLVSVIICLALIIIGFIIIFVVEKKFNYVNN
jgi:putative membrane protein